MENTQFNYSELKSVFWERVISFIKQYYWNWNTIEDFKNLFWITKKKTDNSYSISLYLKSDVTKSIPISWWLINEWTFWKANDWYNSWFQIDWLWFVPLNKYEEIIDDNELLDFDDWLVAAIREDSEEEEINDVISEIDWLPELLNENSEEENTSSFSLWWNELEEWLSDSVDDLLNWDLIWKDFTETINWFSIVNWKINILYNWWEFKTWNSDNNDKDSLDILIAFIERKAEQYKNWKDIFEKINILWNSNWNSYWKSLFISWRHKEQKWVWTKIIWFDFFQIVSFDWEMVSRERLIWWLSPHLVWVTKITFN